MYAAGIGPTHHSTITNGGAILAGCAVALTGARLPSVAGLIGVALIPSGALFWAQPVIVAGAILTISAPIIALVPLAPLGRRAYSVYLWSWPFVLGGWSSPGSGSRAGRETDAERAAQQADHGESSRIARGVGRPVAAVSRYFVRTIGRW
jgi:hypothetical protein